MVNDHLTQENAYIFRICHVDNLSNILRDGCHCRSSAQGQGPYVEIGNRDLIGRRSTREVDCPPGGVLSDYVPFYFTPFSPMLLNIKTGFNGIAMRPMRDIAILVSSLPHLSKQGVPFVFSDRHAYLKAAVFSNDMADLGRIIWPALRARGFRKDDIDKFERYQAEALVYNHVPLSALIGIACYDDAVKARIDAEAAACGAQISVKADRGYFF